MMGSLRAGTHQFRFTFVRRGTTNRQVRIPFLPWTMYDLDGNKEFPSTRDAVGIMTYNPTGIRASCSGGVCRANAARREYPFPRNFDRLNRRSKMAAVTFLFRNKASFLMSYRTTYPHRVFIFRGSLTAMKPRSRLPSRVGRGGTQRRRAARNIRRRRARRGGRICARLYQHSNFRGRQFIVRRSWRFLRGFNDKMSSMRVYRGCKIRIYQHGNWRGKHRLLGPGNYNYNWIRRYFGNDILSSVRVYPNRRRNVRRRRARRNIRRRARRNYRRRRNVRRRRGAKCGTSVVRPRCHGYGCNYRRTYNHGGCR